MAERPPERWPAIVMAPRPVTMAQQAVRQAWELQARRAGLAPAAAFYRWLARERPAWRAEWIEGADDR